MVPGLPAPGGTVRRATYTREGCGPLTGRGRPMRAKSRAAWVATITEMTNAAAGSSQ